MKSSLLVILAFVFFNAGCKKHKAINPLDQLPPETQTGANTFGCLINGQAFKPAGAQLTGGALSSNYQFLNGGYYLRISAVNAKGNTQKAVGLFTDSLKVKQGESYSLDTEKANFAYARYFDAAVGNTADTWVFDTNGTTQKGILTIKKLDTINQIVSGIFCFNAVNGNGDTVKVTDGRFDLRYTR